MQVMNALRGMFRTQGKLTSDETSGASSTSIKRIPDPVQTFVTHWDTDPYALGSYSYQKVGTPQDVFDSLAEAHPPSSSSPRVFFAGEATTRHGNQCVSGSYVSGQRAADEAAALLSLGPIGPA